MLEHLLPSRVFYYFEQLCAIPHGSGNTKAISDYCMSVAATLGLDAEQDEYNNVIIRKAAAPGYESHPTVIIQGHLDMVCEKDADCDLDFEKDGLRLGVDGDWIYAEQTTLGGDDGIAVAMALAVLEDKDLPSPAIEALFTTDEETGMDGAVGLDCSKLQGRILLNADSEEEGVLTVGCAGGARVEARFALKHAPMQERAYIVDVSGLRGGHSGVEIDKGRHNANILMGRFLHGLGSPVVCELGGGSKDNAIPRSCRAVIMTDADVVSAAEQFMKDNYSENDPDLVVSVTPTAASEGWQADELIRFLAQVPNGVIDMNADMDGLVETSLNLGILDMKNGCGVCRFSVRSGVNAKRDALCDRVVALAEHCGATGRQDGKYPAWEYRKQSPLRDTMVAVYRDLFDKDPQVLTIHAGLECGLFCEKMPGLDAVSFGPDMRDIHTSRERLSISSTARTYDYICRILKEL